MKKSVVFVLVAALTLALFAGVAEAKGQGKGKGQGRGRGGDKEATFVFKGTIAQVEEGSVLVDIEKGNKKGHPFLGQQVSFAVNEATRIEKDDAPAVLADLATGDEVVVQSKAPRDATSFTARKVIVQSPEEEPVEEVVPAE